MKNSTKQNTYHPFIAIAFYYTVCLLLIWMYRATGWFEEHYTNFMVLAVALSTYTALFVKFFWKNIQPLLLLKHIKWRLMLVIIVLCVLMASGLFWLQEYMNSVHFSMSYRISLTFWEADYPRLYSLIFLCLQPAIFEELAFRGFVFHQLQKQFSIPISIFLSALLFALLHLSLMSLLWLIPLGILFATFRHQQKSLWYGIVGHFSYNLTIILFEFYRFWEILM